MTNDQYPAYPGTRNMYPEWRFSALGWRISYRVPGSRLRVPAFPINYIPCRQRRKCLGGIYLMSAESGTTGQGRQQQAIRGIRHQATGDRWNEPAQGTTGGHKFQMTIFKTQTSSKTQFSKITKGKRYVHDVWNLELWLLRFICDLFFVIWDFHRRRRAES